MESPATLGWVSLSSVALVEIVKKDSETQSKKRGREGRGQEERQTERISFSVPGYNRGLTNIC